MFVSLSEAKVQILRSLRALRMTGIWRPLQETPKVMSQEYREI